VSIHRRCVDIDTHYASLRIGIEKMEQPLFQEI
jgi:hypothetical protein